MTLQKVIPSLLVILLVSVGQAATFTSTTSGNWNDPATWGLSGSAVEGSTYPGASDDVVVKNGATVTINITTAKASNINLGNNSNPNKGDGTLSFNSGSILTSTGTTTFGDGGQNGYINMTSGGTFVTAIWSNKKGSLTYGTGTIEFTGTFTLQNDAGFDDFYNLTINGGTVTYPKELTIHNDLDLSSGTFASGGKALTINGDWDNNGGTFNEGSGANDAVVFAGSSLQTIEGGETFNDLTINNSSNVQLNGDVTVDGELTFTSGMLDVGANNFYFGTSATVSGASSSNYIDADNASGNVRKYFSSAGSFTFPVGDGNDYSPFAVDFNSGTFGGSAYVGVTVVDAAEPNVDQSGGNSYITRYWSVTSNNILAFNVDIDGTYLGADIVGTEGDIIASLHNGSSWTDGLTASGNTLSVDGLTEFGNLAGRNNPIALPVELTYFNAQMIKAGVYLDWETASEINCEKFVVEASIDGKSFEAIAVINGNGNSQISNHYNTVYSGSTQYNYFRLVQYDFDGKNEVFNTVMVDWPLKNSKVSIYPTLVENQLVIEGELKGELFIYNSEGRFVFHESYYGNTFQKSKLDVTHLNSGIYFVEYQGGGVSISQKIVKK